MTTDTSERTGMAAELQESYEQHGFVHVPGVFDQDELDAMRGAIDGIVERAQLVGRDDDHTWDGARSEAGGEALRLAAWHNVEYHDAAFTRAILHPRMVDVLTSLLGPDVVLHHSKMLVKPPGTGAPFPMHQDHPYFPHEQHSMVAASVHLDDADEANGCLYLVPGSHREGPMQHEGSWQLDAAEFPLEVGTPVPAKAGDVVFFNYLTVHGSGVNRSDRIRRNVLFQYAAAGDRPTLLEHVDWGRGLVVAGCQPRFDWAVPDYVVEGLGELVASG